MPTRNFFLLSGIAPKVPLIHLAVENRDPTHTGTAWVNMVEISMTVSVSCSNSDLRLTAAIGKYQGNYRINLFFRFATPHSEALPKIVEQLAAEMQIGNNNYTMNIGTR
jgi:hypothetical protein